MNIIPTYLLLEVIRDSAGQWDTRRIDLELGNRGAHIGSEILSDLRRIAQEGLMWEDDSEPRGTGPRWHLTDPGQGILMSPEG